MKIIICLLAILPFFLASCGKDDSHPVDPKPAAKELFPLRIGNRWTYEISTYHGYARDRFVKKGDYSTYVTSKDTILDYVWYIVDDDLFKEPTPYMNREDGLWYYETETSLPTFLYHYPTEVGDISYQPGLKFTAVNIDSKIDTPAGVFTCIEYMNTNYKLAIFSFCPGVGLVRNRHIESISEINGAPDTLWEEFLLKSYTLK